MSPLHFLAQETVRERFEFARMPEGGGRLLAAVLMIGAIFLVGWLYRREGPASGWRKGFLVVVRTLILLGMATILLEPVQSRETLRDLTAVTLIVIDDSLSMTVEDRYPEDIAGPLSDASKVPPEEIPNTSRAALARLLLLNTGLLEELAKQNDIRVVALDGTVLLEGTAPPFADKLGPFDPKRGSTNLASGLRGAVGKVTGQPIAAVVLLSDGRSNEGEDPTIAADALARRGIPVHAVGIGDPREPRNAIAVELAAPSRALVKDPISFNVRVRASGLEGESTVLRVTRHRRGEEGGRVVFEKTLSLPATGEEITELFTDRVDEPTKLIYRATLEELEDETDTKDNKVEAPIEIVDEQIRLLMISGGPGREYRALRALLTRDKTVELSCWLQSADPDFPQDGNKRIDRLPDSTEELQEYDVILLCDIEPTGLGGSWIERLKEFVGNHGGGLGFIAGEGGTTRFLQSGEGQSIRPLLPVEPDLATADSAAGSTVNTESWTIEVTPEGTDHPLTRLLGTPEESAVLWASLPGFYSPYPVEREKPGATALLRSTDPRRASRFGQPIVLASHWFGAGRTIFFSTSETWRWRSTAEEIHERFWVGAIRHLTAGRLLGGKRRVILRTDRELYGLGEKVEVTARLLTASYTPVNAPIVKLVVRSPDGTESEVDLVPKDDAAGGWYQGAVLAGQAGLYELSLPSRGDDEGGRTVLRVELPNREFAVTRLDRALLEEIASRTKGTYREPGLAGGVADEIPAKRERLVIPGVSKPLWDRWWVLIGIAGLFTIEWIVRKRSWMA